MKTKTIFIILAVIAIIAIVWFVYQNNKNKNTTTGTLNKTTPKCIAECPDGSNVVYPCGGVPVCASSTSRIIVSGNMNNLNPSGKVGYQK